MRKRVSHSKLVGETDWSKVAVNGTHQNPEWKFPWDVHVLFPRTSPRGRMQVERRGTSRKIKWNENFQFGNSVCGIINDFFR